MDASELTSPRALARLLRWPLLSLALIGAVWSACYWQQRDAAQQARTTALREARHYAQAYQHYLERSLAQMDQVSMQLKYDWERSDGRFDVHELLRQGMFADAAFVNISLYDARGQLRTSSRPALAPRNISQSRAFRHHRDNISTALRIALPAPASNGQDWLEFTRRLDTDDDSFDGIVVLDVDSAWFLAFNQSLGLGQAGLLALRLHEDGSGIVQLETAGKAQYAALRSLPALPGTAENGAAQLTGSAFPDGEARVLGWQNGQAYPVTAMVGMSQTVAQAHLDEDSRSLRWLAWLASACLLAGGTAASLVSWRLAQRERAEAAIRAAYRTATEHANDGFFLVTPVEDGRARITDFVIDDCNERGASFYGLGRADLLGMRLSQLHAEARAYFDHLVHDYTQALHSGFGQADVAMPRESRLRIEWAQRTLVRAGPRLAVTLHDITRQKRHESELTKLANEDTLTGLPNRHWLRAQLPRLLDQADKFDQRLALLFIDLDGFKQVNDTLGHAQGDALLRVTAERLRQLLRPDDHVVRLGGDEFLVVLPAVESATAAAQVGERILRALSQSVTLGDTPVQVGASIGVSCYPDDGTDADALLQHADIAMYAGKTDGKGQVRHFHPALFEHLRMRSAARQALRMALDDDQFVLFYQPRLGAADGQLRSMEALLRWEHPQRGTVGPAEFIALAEVQGLMPELGRVVMEKACAQQAAWLAQGLPLVPVSINVSPTQFAQGQVDRQLEEALARHALPAHWIEVEITESAMMGEQSEVQAQLHGLRQLGIKLYIDDFGTGYSSLGQLQRLRMDGLKVDRAFTRELGGSRDGRILFEAIVSMAHALGMSVVAEGVETEEQLEILRTLCCDEVQGFLLARPMPATAIADCLAACRPNLRAA